MADAFNSLGSQHGVITNAVGGTLLTLPAGKTVRHMIIAVQSSGARWTGQGMAPTVGAAGTAVGFPAVQDSTIEFMDPEIDYSGLIRQFKIIGNPSNINVNIEYYS